jgi:hypothetical protein
MASGVTSAAVGHDERARTVQGSIAYVQVLEQIELGLRAD